LKLRDQDFIKNHETETRDLKFETETSIFGHFADFFKCRHHFLVEIFQISGIFPSYFCCFSPASTTKKNSLNYRNFTKPFLCNIQSLETYSLRDQDETWNLRDRDLQKRVSRRVSRPRPSLETPSLELWLSQSRI